MRPNFTRNWKSMDMVMTTFISSIMIMIIFQGFLVVKAHPDSSSSDQSNPPPISGQPEIKPPDNMTAIVGVYYSEYFTLSNYTGSVNWRFKTNASTWLIRNNHGLVRGTPPVDALPRYYITANASYGSSQNIVRTFLLNVTGGDPKIKIEYQILEDATEEELYEVDFETNGYGTPPIKWSMFGNCSFLTLNSSSGLVSGIPDDEDVGLSWFNISVKDGENYSYYYNYTINVIGVNDPPNITTMDFPLFINEDETMIFDFNATNPDPDDYLRWTLQANCSFLYINELTGILQGDPDNDDVGTWPITITATDKEKLSDTIRYNLTVLNVNDAPVISTEPYQSYNVNEDSQFSIQFFALDVDDDRGSLNWSVQTEHTWLHINRSTGLLNGTPTNDDVGNGSVKIVVKDGSNGMDHVQFNISVLNVNDAPTLESSGPITAPEGMIFSFQAFAFDSDPTNDTITWSMNTSADFLSIDPETGMISGHPSFKDIGTWSFAITVRDDHGAASTMEFYLIIENVNEAPVIDPCGSLTLSEDIPFSKQMVAHDLDPTNDILTWNLITDADFLSLDPESGLLIGEPDNDDVGEWSLRIEVFDNHNAFSFIIVNLTVRNTNDPPLWISIPQNVIIETDETFRFVIEAMDIDPFDEITFTMTSDEEYNFDPLTGEFIFNPLTTGEFIFNSSATDGIATIWHEFIIVATDNTIDPSIEEPEPLAIQNQTTEVGSPITINILPEGEYAGYTFQIIEGPEGIAIDEHGIIRWEPSSTQTGEHRIIVSIQEGDNLTTAEFSIMVQPEEKDRDENRNVDELQILLIFSLIIIALILGLLIVSIFLIRGRNEFTLDPQEE